MAYDGLAVVVHPKNTWATSMTVAELKKLWEPAAQGQVMRWNQIRAGWPDREIHLFGAGVDSGTFDYFTEAIVGKTDQSRGDYTSSEDDNVIVQGVSGDELALGYFGYAYYEENKDKLKVLAIDDGNEANGAGAILPSPASCRRWVVPSAVAAHLHLPAREIAGSRRGQELRRLLPCRRERTRQRSGLHSAHATKEYELVRARFAARKTGSMYHGDSQRGMTLDRAALAVASGCSRPCASDPAPSSSCSSNARSFCVRPARS